MTKPTSITLPLNYNSDGTLDTNSLMLALENALEDRVRITDWYDESSAMADYPDLDEEQRREMIAAISIGDYDEAIDREIRKDVLDKAADFARIDVEMDIC